MTIFLLIKPTLVLIRDLNSGMDFETGRLGTRYLIKPYTETLVAPATLTGHAVSHQFLRILFIALFNLKNFLENALEKMTRKIMLSLNSRIRVWTHV